MGHPRAHLWVDVAGADDMDLFVVVHKLDPYGTPLSAFTVLNQGARLQDLTQRGESILR